MSDLEEGEVILGEPQKVETKVILVN